MSVNVASKNHLARLLATENIYIRHSSEVTTASFDTVQRILTFPLWQDMTDEIYTMLAGHEVGHALWTPQKWIDELAKEVDPKNPQVAGMYINVIEDVRIERLIKSVYPGIRLIFSTAYHQLYQQNMFGTDGTTIDTRCFIDRANLHYKIGAHLPSIAFSDVEQRFIERMDKTETYNEVSQLAKEIYEWAKEIPPPEQPKTEEKSQGTTPEPQRTGSGEPQQNFSADEPISKEHSQGNSSTQQPKNKSSASGPNVSSKKKQCRPAPIPETQANFDSNVKKQFANKNGINLVYVTLPTPKLDAIIEDYKSVLARNINISESAETAFLEFQNKNASKINYILTQFEMKKRAAQYKRIKVHKTGSLDTLRLHSYKFEDDLFKTISITQDGKNHGLLFLIDWSGSMNHNMAGTIQQLIVLTLFCRKAQIPFDVFSISMDHKHTDDSFVFVPGDLSFIDNFKMRNYLSSRMTSQEFYQACKLLFSFIHTGRFHSTAQEDKLIGCTPLDEGIITCIELVKKMRETTKAQIINTVILTDNGANTVNSYIGKKNQAILMGKKDTEYVIEDKLTHKQYIFSATNEDITKICLEILKDRGEVRAVGFYITNDFDESFFPDEVFLDKLEQEFNENGYVVCHSFGFNELYIIKGNENLKITEVELTPKRNGVKIKPQDPNFLPTALSNFIEKGNSIVKQRVMLDKFVNMIA